MMRISGSFLAILLLTGLPTSAQTSPTAVRDSNAVTLLTEAVTAAGGLSAITEVKDFTGWGSITYFWAGEQVDGSVTVRGLGLSLFRLDAELPEGTRSWLVTDTQGSIRNFDGATKPIEYADAVSYGSIAFPYPRIAVALGDASFSVSMAGSTTVNGRQANIVRVQPTFPTGDDPGGTIAKLNTKSYVIDAQTFALLAVRDTLYSDDGRERPVPHEVLFSNFTQVSGMTVPFAIEEEVDGQPTWVLRLSSMTFNNGIDATVFAF